VNDVDVIVVNFRSGGVLESAVRDVQKWLGQRALVTVVDNSPDDGAVDLLRQAHPEIRVISNAVNKGFGAAVNQAIRATSARYVLLLNPDVRGIRGPFAEIEQIFAEHESVAAVAPRLVNADGSLQRNARREPRLRDLFVDIFGLRNRFPSWRRLFSAHYGDWDYSTARTVDAAIGALLVLRRAALERVGLLDERYFVYAEETDWLVRAKAMGWKTVLTPAVEAVHDLRGSTDAGEAALSLFLVESEHKYARKHFGAATAALFRAVAVLIDGLRWMIAGARGASRREHRRSLEKRMLVHLGRDARSVAPRGETRGQ
jgi:GT2 family glycosyltransferase